MLGSATDILIKKPAEISAGRAIILQAQQHLLSGMLAVDPGEAELTEANLRIAVANDAGIAQLTTFFQSDEFYRDFAALFSGETPVLHDRPEYIMTHQEYHSGFGSYVEDQFKIETYYCAVDDFEDENPALPLQDLLGVRAVLLAQAWKNSKPIRLHPEQEEAHPYLDNFQTIIAVRTLYAQLMLHRGKLSTKEQKRGITELMAYVKAQYSAAHMTAPPLPTTIDEAFAAIAEAKIYLEPDIDVDTSSHVAVMDTNPRPVSDAEKLFIAMESQERYEEARKLVRRFEAEVSAARKEMTHVADILAEPEEDEASKTSRKREPLVDHQENILSAAKVVATLDKAKETQLTGREFRRELTSHYKRRLKRLEEEIARLEQHLQEAQANAGVAARHVEKTTNAYLPPFQSLKTPESRAQILADYARARVPKHLQLPKADHDNLITALEDGRDTAIHAAFSTLLAQATTQAPQRKRYAWQSKPKKTQDHSAVLAVFNLEHFAPHMHNLVLSHLQMTLMASEPDSTANISTTKYREKTSPTRPLKTLRKRATRKVAPAASGTDASNHGAGGDDRTATSAATLRRVRQAWVDAATDDAGAAAALESADTTTKVEPFQGDGDTRPLQAAIGEAAAKTDQKGSECRGTKP